MKNVDDKGTGSLLPVFLPETPSGDFDEILAGEIRRLGGVYMRHLRTKYIPLDEISEQVAYIMKMLYIFSTNRLDDLKNLKKFSEIQDYLRVELGLKNIYDWLSVHKAELILKQSGKEKQFQELWKFRYNKNTASYFSDPAEYRRQVKDLNAWFRVVNYLITQSTKRSRTRLTSARGDEMRWEKFSVCYVLLISLTLNSEKIEYSFKEINRFLRLVDNYDYWLKDLQKKIINFPPESGIRELFEGDDMKSLLEKLKIPAERSLIKFAEYLPFRGAERDNLTQLNTMFSFSVGHTFNHPAKVFRSVQLKEGREKLSQIIKEKWSIESTYEFLLKKPVFFFWLDDSVLREVLVWDDFVSGELTKLAHQSHRIDQKLEEMLSKTYRMSEFFHALIKKQEPFNKVFSWASRNAKISGESLSKGWEDRREKEAFSAIASELSLMTFRELLLEMEKEAPVNPASIPTYACLGIYLEYLDEEIPHCVTENLSKQKWFLYINNKSTQDLFRKLINDREKARNKPLATNAEMVIIETAKS